MAGQVWDGGGGGGRTRQRFRAPRAVAHTHTTLHRCRCAATTAGGAPPPPGTPVTAPQLMSDALYSYVLDHTRESDVRERGTEGVEG